MAIKPPDVRAAEAVLRAFKKARKRPPKDRPKRENKQERQRDPLYLAWVRRQACTARHKGGCAGAIEAAHIRMSDAARGWANPGMQRKPDDDRAVPLCSAHHREGPHAQHRGSERAFWAWVGLNPADVCASLRARYLGETKRG